MAENSSRGPNRKLGLIAPLSIAAVIALVILGAVLLTARRAEPEPEPEPPPPPPAASAPVTPPEDPVLTRADLIAAADAAAAAFAGDGAVNAAEASALVGRRFRVRIPVGCEGPQVRPGPVQAYYEFDPEARTIRLVARPADWTALPLVQQTTPQGALEAVEGFWIPQPWSRSEGCPRRREAPVPASPTPPSAETLGLARLFAPEESRVGRRGGRPYEHVIRLAEDEAPPLVRGYRLVLEGRLAAFPDGRAAHCWSESAAHRPICLFAATFERVAFESADGEKQLAEWRD